MYFDEMEKPDPELLNIVKDVFEAELYEGTIEEYELLHYGVKRRSGRYPWGSGDSPYQHSGDFLARVEADQQRGLSEREIANALDMSTKELRMARSIAIEQRRSELVNQAENYRKHGDSLQTIAKKMGYANDSSVRSLLNEKSKARMNQAKETAEFLKKRLEKDQLLDVGSGVEYQLNISRTKLDEALYRLQLDGYHVYGRMVPQATNPGKNTIIKVLTTPDIKNSDLYSRLGEIKSVEDYISRDDGKTFEKKFVYPESMDSKRLQIRYAEDGGIHKDGVIELRRGVKDLDLGGSHYAQVRILVDGTHYLKGMAVYSDNMPDGVDVIFNTNKKKGTPVCGPKNDTVLKPIKNDPENPFGSLIKEKGGQSRYIDSDGKSKLSLINKRSDEGDWGDWSDKLPSQFLSKQNISLVKKQLGLAVADKQAEYDDIMQIPNPTIRKYMLKSFADGCDSTSVHLEAAALPNQKYKVILPLTSISDKEIYAPGYRDGEQVALVRYPHGGTFEIPILTVNNRNKEGSKVITPQSKDGVGISSSVAERLSGADFDGDTVMVIPANDKVRITSTPPLKGLEGFDPKMAYPYHEGMKKMTNTQNEMGKISNLITDMTLKGANQEELAAAVRHSMVVIDAEKHSLDYKQSEVDNHIQALKKKYQGHINPETGRMNYGAATIISRAKSEYSVPKRKGSPIIDPETGKYIWKEANEDYVDKKTGKTIQRTQKSTKMAEVDDAFELVSGKPGEPGHPVEKAYAEYANKMKSMANNARKDILAVKDSTYSASAAETYKMEVESLEAKLNLAIQNSPRERRAQVIARSQLEAQKRDNPGMTKEEQKKYATRALQSARIDVGSKRQAITFTDKEWEAVQAGAIRPTKLSQMLMRADSDALKQRILPKNNTSLRPAQISKIKAMSGSDYTMRQIADALGVSMSTVEKYL